MATKVFILVLVLGAIAVKESTTQAKSISDDDIKSLIEDKDASDQIFNSISKEISQEKGSNNSQKERQLSATCTNNAANCKACASSSLCGTCTTSGYLPDTSGGCTQSPLSNCAIVSGQFTCDTCSTGYYSDCTPCSSLISQCSSCSDSQTCSTCNKGYRLVSNSCVPCSGSGSGVASCYNDDSIFSCSTGYYFEASTCKLCTGKYGPNCISCSLFSGCDKCSPGFLPDTSSNCVSASVPNCGKLVSGSTSQCDTCNDGYYESSGSCIKISCSSTQAWDENSKVCKECNSVITNCKTCSQYYCNECLPGFAINMMGYCVVSTATNCITVDFSDQNKCTKCASGYLLNDSGVCYQSDLKNCDKISDPLTCAQCSYGYIESCVACGSTPITGCDCPSSDSSYCVKCKTNWVQNGSGCSSNCPSNCEKCSGSNVCTQCSPGYFLYDNNGDTTCISCNDSCSSCSPNPECFECADLVVQDGSSCRVDKIGYQLSFKNPNIVIDFAHPTSKSLAINTLAAKDSHGNTLYTTGWSITSASTVNQIQITTNLTESLLPIDIEFTFLQNS